MTLLQLRFYIGLAICVVAGTVGLMAPKNATPAELAQRTMTLAPLSGPDQADVQQYVERLAATDLFPSARTVASMTNIDAGPATAAVRGETADDAQASTSPAIRALVRREAQWRLYAAQQGSLISVFEPGEELFGGWAISSISARTLTLERDGETQTIDVLMAGESG